MAAVTSTVTLNAAFLQEIKEDNHELQRLLAECREVFEERRAFSRKRLEAILTELCDRLAMHFALEEAFGYFDDPVSVAPRLSRQAEALRSQHSALFLEVRAIADEHDRLVGRMGAHGLMHHLAPRFRGFDEKLRQHEAAENELILEAFDDDIGVGD
jgi:hypothetical protein